MNQDTDQTAEYIIDAVLENTEIEIPQEDLDREIFRLSAMYNRQLHYDMIQSGDLSRFKPDYLESCRPNLQHISKKQLKTELLLHYVAEQEHISVTAEELEREAMEISRSNNIPLKMVKDFLGENYDLLKDDLLLEKTITWMHDYVIACN